MTCAELDGAERGLVPIDAIAPAAVAVHQPYWALRAHLPQWTGRRDEAKAACDRAIGLSQDPAVRTFLLGRMTSAKPPPR